jgi:type IX secretion system PorP/SprF family membrane protein
MKKIQNIVAVIALLISIQAISQEESNLTMYRYNMNLFNPAYAGMNNETLVSTSIRSQWTAVPGAPSTQVFSFGTPVGKNLGIGVSILNEKTFIEKQSNVAIDFSYKLKMNETIDFYFGVKAGGNFYDLNLSGLKTYNVTVDNALSNINTFNPNIGVGGVLLNEKWFVAVSVPKLLSTTKVKNESENLTIATDRAHFYVSGGYDFDLSDSFTLKSSTMMRYVNAAPLSVDLNAMLSYENKFEFGATYRTDQAYALMTTIAVNESFIFGYAYEMSTRATLAQASNTNEILLRFKF